MSEYVVFGSEDIPVAPGDVVKFIASHGDNDGVDEDMAVPNENSASLFAQIALTF